MISYIFMGFGFMVLLRGDFIGGLWILLMGWFLHSGAQSYMSQFELTTSLKGITVENIMNTKIISVKQDSSIYSVLRDFFMINMKSELPVTDEQSHLLGMITLKAILDVPENQREIVQVQDMMIPPKYLAVMEPHAQAEKALLEMIQKRVGKVFVCDNDGKLLGVVSKTDIIELASERQKYLHSIKSTMKS